MQPAAADGLMTALLQTSATALRRLIAWPSRMAMYVGAVALVLIMGITVADVVMRNLFAIVVPGGMEMTGLLMTLVAL